MTRQQQRAEAIKCAKTRTKPAIEIEAWFKWSLITDLFGERLKCNEPIGQVLEIVENRELFGEVLIAMYDYNVDGFSCVESGKGELFISALSEV